MEEISAVEGLGGIFVFCGAIGALLCMLAIIGGGMAIRRENWVLL